LVRQGRSGNAIKKLKEYPGETLADKAEAFFLKLGFTKEDVRRLRERLLEPHTLGVRCEG